MPRAPSNLRFLPEAQGDLVEIKAHNPDHPQRIFDKIADWKDKIQWGRVPQEHLTYLTGSGAHNFYREYVGKSGYRIVYEISGDTMTVVGVFPKGEHTYDIEAFERRMDRL